MSSFIISSLPPILPNHFIQKKSLITNIITYIPHLPISLKSFIGAQ